MPSRVRLITTLLMIQVVYQLLELRKIRAVFIIFMLISITCPSLPRSRRRICSSGLSAGRRVSLPCPFAGKNITWFICLRNMLIPFWWDWFRKRLSMPAWTSCRPLPWLFSCFWLYCSVVPIFSLCTIGISWPCPKRIRKSCTRSSCFRHCRTMWMMPFWWWIVRLCAWTISAPMWPDW